MDEHRKLHEFFMRSAITLAEVGLFRGDGGPFGCIITRGERVVGSGTNQVTSTNDPTAHAEVVAIRSACQTLGTFALHGCVLYSTCEPCPMCFAAAHWARVEAIWFGSSRDDAAAIGFDDALLYQQIALPNTERALPMHQILRDEAQRPFAAWQAMPDKTPY
ncbi:MAG: nucleoside deaminase [Planctomycetes bacterium]|nr:nucleoside deaminase [Planctomycetota bacterium]